MNLRKVAGKLGLLKGFQPRVPPKRVPTDTVVPVPFWDDMKICRDFSRDYTYLFNDVLDTRKLQQSLERLMRLGGWRKLGARIRPGVSGLSLVILNDRDNERDILTRTRGTEGWSTTYQRSMTKKGRDFLLPRPSIR